MKKVDIHTHIIPNIDDGSKSVEMSRRMLEMLKAQEFTDVCLTPHFDPRVGPISDFVKQRNEYFEQIKYLFDELEITPHLGAEVLFQKNLFHKTDIDLLCVDGKDKILIEMPFEAVDSSELLDLIYKLSSDFSITPVIVHPERYKDFFCEGFLMELCNSDCIIQSDIEELANFFLRKKIKKFFKKDLVHTFGSDCHNVTERKPDFSILSKAFDDEQINVIMENALRVIE